MTETEKTEAAKSATSKREKMGNTIVKIQPISSFRDAVTQAAQSQSRGLTVVHWLRANVANWPELSKEDKASFFEYASDYHQTLVPGQYYKREGIDTYSPLTGKPGKDVESVLIDTDYAMGLTGQQFGALRKDQPNLHGLIKSRRDAAKKYASNLLAYLIRLDAADRATGKGKRSVTRTFHETVTETFDSWGKKIAAAAARGDDTAPTAAKLKTAIAAFWAALK